ncbi:hypothetical protein HanXRQr2_Chr04g0190831 [Helianthus annuus]|uniref:Uncharacterized protein n=1 Tax=Helianthus annuus TaxID=4232 RepID=A0A9K3NTN2_HELAN|nr:hypothetical protein HanXRQr2_Chr04g0190831 [Helianthus annuus]
MAAAPDPYMSIFGRLLVGLGVGNLKLKCSCWAHSQLVPFCWMDSQRLYIQGYV